MSTATISSADTMELIRYAQEKLGYGIEKLEDAGVRGENYYRRIGAYQAYSSEGACVAKASWDSGARRPTPDEFRFRKGSPHHAAVLELLQRIAEHSGDRYLAARLEPKQ